MIGAAMAQVAPHRVLGLHLNFFPTFPTPWMSTLGQLLMSPVDFDKASLPLPRLLAKYAARVSASSYVSLLSSC